MIIGWSLLSRRFLFAVLCFATVTAMGGEAPRSRSYYVVGIDNLGATRLTEVKTTRGVAWWVEADDQLLVLADRGLLQANSLSGLKVTELAVVPNESRLAIVRNGHSGKTQSLAADVLVAGGRAAVVQARHDGKLDVRDEHNHGKAGTAVLAFAANTVLAAQAANQQLPEFKASSPQIAALVDQVDPQRWFQDVEKLASWNRFSRGQQVLAARDWLAEEFRKLPNLQVEFQEFDMGVKAYNVIATLKGSDASDDWYIVGGHYDSISENTSVSAPGAEDNASGAAGVLELARSLALTQPKKTIVFIAFSGEEQGLIGSYRHAAKISADGSLAHLKGVINMDMIGYTRGGELGCLLETAPVGEPLMRQLLAAAQEFTTLRITTTLDAWGSDHVPYLERDIPAVLTIDKDWDDYPAYHRTADKPANITVAMGAEILKMNLAVLAKLAVGLDK